MASKEDPLALTMDDDQLEIEANRKPYNKDYLQPGCSSKQYLKSVSYNVYISGECLVMIIKFIDLFKIRECCTKIESYNYYPILLEIMDADLRVLYGG
jgi:hypothetical protein